MSFKAPFLCKLFSRGLSESLGSPEPPLRADERSGGAWSFHSQSPMWLGSISVLSRIAPTCGAGTCGKKLQRFHYIFLLNFQD